MNKEQLITNLENELSVEESQIFDDVNSTDMEIALHEKICRIIHKSIQAIKQLNETPVERSKFIEFLDSIRDYEKESHNMIGFDERESSEFVDIYLNKNSLNAAKRIES